MSDISTPVSTVTRDITDLGLRLTVDLPTTWTEVPVENTVLTVGGPLDEEPGTLVPTVQVGIRTAPDAGAAARAVTSVTDHLVDAVVGFTDQRVTHGGDEETVVEVAHRSELVGATQVSMFRSVYLADRGLAVVVVGSCGGGASPRARDALREVVRSVEVVELSQPGL